MRWLLVVALLSIVILGSPSLDGVARAGLGCPTGSLPHLLTGSCLPIVDRTADFSPDAYPPTVPNLAELRMSAHGSPQPFLPKSSPPVPAGVLSAGVVYEVGQLKATNDALLGTYMTVHPAGIGSLDGFAYSTATNRTEKGVEVVGMYPPDAPEGRLGIFDWSCSPGYPCSNGAIFPSWIWEIPFADVPCWYEVDYDSGGNTGHFRNKLLYYNETDRIDSGNPPLWRNKVYILNHCTHFFELVYNHDYRVNQKDCSLDNSCGWWGPIIETFFVPLPEIKELGFDAAFLAHDGVYSDLGSDETDWVPPATSLWAECHRDPNSTWGIGSFEWSVPAGDEDCDGFESPKETFMGTITHKACPATSVADDEVMDAWPPDFNDDQLVSIADVVLWGEHYPSSTGDPKYDPRFDLNADGKISIMDNLILGQFFGLNCSVP